MSKDAIHSPVSYIVIPARLSSTRLPRKLLLRETGKTLLEHTYRAACRARKPAGVCVAVDDEELAAEVRRFGGRAFMTSRECASGTDRLAEVAPRLAEADILVNVQGDEPELSGESIDLVVSLLEAHPEAKMATLATPIRSRETLLDPSCVKVVFAERGTPKGALRGPHFPVRPEGAGPGLGGGSRWGKALYFSRSPIPHAREWRDELLEAMPAPFHLHIGLYAYRREFLIELARQPRSPLEKLENLEQLRALERGEEILVGVVEEPSIGIDTPEDYRRFVERARAGC